MSQTQRLKELGLAWNKLSDTANRLAAELDRLPRLDLMELHSLQMRWVNAFVLSLKFLNVDDLISRIEFMQERLEMNLEVALEGPRLSPSESGVEPEELEAIREEIKALGRIQDSSPQ